MLRKTLFVFMLLSGLLSLHAGEQRELVKLANSSISSIERANNYLLKPLICYSLFQDSPIQDSFSYYYMSNLFSSFTNPYLVKEIKKQNGDFSFKEKVGKTILWSGVIAAEFLTEHYTETTIPFKFARKAHIFGPIWFSGNEPLLGRIRSLHLFSLIGFAGSIGALLYQ